MKDTKKHRNNSQNWQMYLKMKLDLHYPDIRYKMLEVIKKFALYASKANFFIIFNTISRLTVFSFRLQPLRPYAVIQSR